MQRMVCALSVCSMRFHALSVGANSENPLLGSVSSPTDSYVCRKLVKMLRLATPLVKLLMKGGQELLDGGAGGPVCAGTVIISMIPKSGRRANCNTQRIRPKRLHPLYR